MKTTNLDPEHQLDVTRGRKSTLRSGSTGVTVRDGTTTGFDIFDITVVGGTWTVDEDGTAVLTIGQGSVLIPEATISATKDADNPTFPFAGLVENVNKVGSTYYVPYTTATVGDVKLATASDRDGPWAHDSTIFTQASVAWRGTHGLYAPEITEHDGTFYLFYSLIATGGVTSSLNAIGYATASAITGPYTDHGSAILSPAAAGAWDSRRVGEPSVIFHGGQWIMAYMGEDSDLAYQASEQIGIATAPDPAGPWTRHGLKIALGASGAWDDGVVADPALFFANGYYWIWYPGGTDVGPDHGQNVNMGLAYATDPTGTWTKFTGNPVLLNGGAGDFDDWWVTRGGMWLENGQWGGVYTGYDGTTFQGGNFRLDIDSAGVSSVPTAGDILIADAGGYYTSDEVEGALQEIGADLAAVLAGGSGHYEVIVSGSGPPVAVTNSAGTDWLYGFVPE